MRFLIAFILVTLVAAAGGCSDPKPVRNVRLVVTNDGRYLFEGKAVSDNELKDRLRAIKAEGVKIDLHILGSSNAKYERVGGAVKIAQDAGVELVGFITEPPVSGSLPSAVLPASANVR